MQLGFPYCKIVRSKFSGFMNSEEFNNCRWNTIVAFTAFLMVLLIILVLANPLSGQALSGLEVFLILLIPTLICTFIAYRRSSDESDFEANDAVSPV